MNNLGCLDNFQSCDFRRRYLNNALVQAQNAQRGNLEVVAILAAIELKMGQVAFPGKTSKGQFIVLDYSITDCRLQRSKSLKFCFKEYDNVGL